MTSSTKLKEAFDLESKHGAFYTGGNVEWIEDTLYCQASSEINILSIENGIVVKSIGEESTEDSDFIQTFTTDGTRTVTSHKSGLLKLWNQNGEVTKMWKYIHKGPIAKLCLNQDILVSGGSDSVVRLWDLKHQACTSSLRGCQGVINLVHFHPYNENGVFASGDDGKINYYAVDSGKLEVIYDAHFSKVTSLGFVSDEKHFVSAGRDKVLILWEYGKLSPLKTIAVYEAVESIASIPHTFKLPDFKPDSNSFYVASGGENGIVRVWDMLKAKEVFAQTNSMVSKCSEEGGLAITRIIYDTKTKSLAVISADHNIIIHHLKSFVILKQFVGFTDDILDVTYFGKNDSHVAVATNSKDIKLYDNATMNCQLLRGHTDIVLALCTSKTDPNLLLSSGKDNTVRLWVFDGSFMTCVAIGKRHTGSVGAIAFAQTSASFAVSAGQDTCLKVWEIPSNFDKKDASINCKFTAIAHEKEINCITVSPSDQFVASASQDKTAKLWTSKLELIGVLKGHKRGVWCIRFSPVDKVVITSSADCTIKLWSVDNLNCLKTLDGHESSVIKVEFLSQGMQVLSAGADGLLKLFTIKNSECVCTLEQHDGRIWAMAVKNDETGMVTGGSDSLLLKWKDVTEERKIQRQKEMEELVIEEQKLSNYIQNDDYLKALKLALNLDRPLKTLKIIQGIIRKGDTGLSDTIKQLRNDQKESLMKCALTWNTNSRNQQPAQLVINLLITELQTGEFRPVGLRSMIEQALPYTERHYKRMTQFMQDLHLINYTINCMKPNARST